MNLIADTIRAATGSSAELAALYAPHLSEACSEFGITTPGRLAAFLAQVGHESGGLRYTAEVWGPTPAQLRYEGRKDLGNIEPGDGGKFRGHGLIQVTGRANHAAARDRLREKFGGDVPDFEARPTALEQARWAAMSAADFWFRHGCNELADHGEFDAITQRINGGQNGAEDRRARWTKAKLALAVMSESAAPTPTPVELPPVEIRQLPPEIDQPTKEPIVGASLLWGLASSLIDIFTPLAKEKITKEIGRHTSDTAVQDQVATAVIEKAKELTGKSDPIEATVAAKAAPAVLAAVETSALDVLDRLAPVLDKLAVWDKQAWTAEDEGRDAAAARGRAEAADLAPMLASWAVKGLFGMIGGLAVLVLAQIIVTPDHKASGELLTALTGLAMLAAGRASTVYDYRFGSSRSSSGKDVVIGELSRRPKPGP